MEFGSFNMSFDRGLGGDGGYMSGGSRLMSNVSMDGINLDVYLILEYYKRMSFYD